MFVLFALESDWVRALLSLVSGVFSLGVCMPFVIDTWRDNRAMGLVAGFIATGVFAIGIWLVIPLVIGVLVFAALVAIGFAGWKLGVLFAR